MKIQMLLALAAIASGCICCGSQSVEPAQETYSTEPSAEPLADLPADEVSVPDDEPLLEADYDWGQVVIQVAGCDSDTRGKAMVAGYVENRGEEDTPELTIVTRLTDKNGLEVEGGAKNATLAGLNPGERRKFSSVYESPPAWSKCSAYIYEAR